MDSQRKQEIESLIRGKLEDLHNTILSEYGHLLPNARLSSSVFWVAISCQAEALFEEEQQKLIGEQER